MSTMAPPPSLPFVVGETCLWFGRDQEPVKEQEEQREHPGTT